MSSRRILIALVILGTLAASAAAETLGLYFDQSTWETDVDTTVPVDVWLVLRDITSPLLVAAWECSIETTADGPPPVIAWELLGYGPYNYSSPPQFIVGLHTPMPVGQDVPLARGTVFVSGSLAVDLRVQPYLDPSITDADGLSVWRPALARGPSGDVLQVVDPAGGGSWVPEARLNPVGAVPLSGLTLDGDLAFGSVPPGSQSVTTVTLHNPGPAALYGRLGAEGDGFSLRLDDDPWAPARWVHLPPAADVDIEVRFAPAFAGPAYGALVFDDGGALAIGPLSGGGNAVPPASLTPAWLDFGVVPPGAQSLRTVIVRNTSAAAITVVPGLPASPFALIDPPASAVLAPGEELTLTVAMVAALPGLQRLDLDLGVGLPPVLGRGYTPLDAGCSVNVDDPLAGDFGTVVTGEAVVRTVEFLNDGQWELSGDVTLAGDTDVFSLISGDGFVTLPPGASHLVEVRCAPTDAGAWQALLTGPLLCQDLPLACVAEWPTPACRVHPEAVDFGEVLVGLTGSNLVWLVNTGNVTLDGQPSIAGGAQFSLATGDPFAVAPGDSINREVIFAPADAGPATASLDFGVDTCGPVPLTGAGRLPVVGCEVPATLDFGTVSVGIETLRNVTVTNPGELPLTIVPQVSGAGFSLPDPSTVVVPAGEAAAIAVRIRPEAAGPYDGLLSLGHPVCDDVVLLAVVQYSQIGGPCTLRPTSIEFPETAVLATAEHDVAVINGTLAAFDVTLIVDDSVHFGSGQTGPVTVPSHQARWLQAAFRPLAPACKSATSAAGLGANYVTVSGRAVSNGCDVDPVVRTFPTLVFGAPLSRTVAVTNTGDQDLAIATACDDPAFVAAPALADVGPGTTLTITVTFTAPAPGHYEAVLSLGDAICTDVRLVADALDEDETCVVDPVQWSVPEAYAGIPETTSISIRNNGNENLPLAATILPATEGFSVLSAPAAVGPGAVGTVALQFLSATPGLHSATLSLGPDACQDVALSATVGDLPPGDCILNPASVILPEMPVGMSMILDYGIANGGQTPLVVDLADEEGFVRWLEGGGTHVIGPGSSIAGRVRFFAPSQGEFSYVVEVSPGVCGIQVSGYGTSPLYPCELDPFVVDFGGVVVGQARNEYLTLRNIGDVAIAIDPVDQVGPFQIIPAGPRTVYVLQVFRPTVRFAPTTAGEYYLAIGLGLEGCGPILARGTAVPTASGVVAVDPRLDFGVLGAGRTAGLPLVIRNLGEQAASFQPSISGDGYALVDAAASYTLAPGAEVRLDVTCTAAADGQASQGQLQLGLPDHPAVVLTYTDLDAAASLPLLRILWDDGLVADADGTTRLVGGQSSARGRLQVAGLAPGDEVVRWRGAMTCSGGDLLAWQPAGVTERVTLAGEVPLTLLPAAPLTVAADGTLDLATFTVVVAGDGPTSLRADGGAGADWPQLGFATGDRTLAAVTAAADHTLARLVVSHEPDAPRVTRIHPVYPNPFNPTTTIPLDLARGGRVRLAVFDVAGKKIRIIVDESRAAGSYVEQWDGRDATGRRAASGAYYLRLEAGGEVQLQKMTMLK
ncbi:MAG: choice-of-anchor D domain-containing protein [Candidatus Krumholzibacteriia bacterium]